MGGWAGRRAFDTEAISICIASIHSCGIGIEADAAGIDIPASCILVRYRSIPVQDWVLLSLYRTGSGIGVFVHSGIRLIRCRTVRHSGIIKKYTPHVHTANLR
jgi:hypothetical protein